MTKFKLLLREGISFEDDTEFEDETDTRTTPVLTITSEDTETLSNAVIKITAKNTNNDAIEGLALTGTIGEEALTGTTNSSGVYSVTLESTGEYAVSVESTADTNYKSATATSTIEVSTISVEQGQG